MRGPPVYRRGKENPRIINRNPWWDSRTIKTLCAKYKCKFSLSQTENNDDFVTIYDGPNDQSTEIEKLSGNLGSFNILSTGNYLLVKFYSDDYINYGGFLATIHYGNPYLNMK